MQKIHFKLYINLHFDILALLYKKNLCDSNAHKTHYGVMVITLMVITFIGLNSEKYLSMQCFQQSYLLIF